MQELLFKIVVQKILTSFHTEWLTDVPCSDMLPALEVDLDEVSLQKWCRKD